MRAHACAQGHGSAGEGDGAARPKAQRRKIAWQPRPATRESDKDRAAWRARTQGQAPGGHQRGRPSEDQVQLNKRLTRCDSPEAVIVQLKAAEESALPLTAVNIVTAMHRVAKTSAAGRLLRQEDALLLLRLVDGELKSGTDSSALDDRALTTLAWSLGSLYQTFTDKAVDGRRLEQHEQHEELPQHVQRLLGRIIQLLQSRSLSHIPAQGLSNVAWSCAKCNLRGNETALLLDRISTVLQAGRAERSWNAQDLSNLAWAYGRLRSGCSLGPQDLAALEAISTAALTLGLHGFWPQGLSNLLWAHASLGVRCDELCEAICNEAAARQLDGFSSQEISNLAWAATVIDGSMRGSLCGAISSWLQTADGFEGIFFDRAQEVSITLWAFAKAQAPCEQLVAYARQRVLDEPGWLGDFSCQALSNLVWSLAKLHSLHRESGDTSITIAQVLIEVERRTLQQFKAQEISQMLHALATSEGRVTAQGNALLHAFEEHALSRGLTEFEEKHLACISWVCGLRIKRSLVGQDAREASDDRSFGVPASFVRHHRTRRAGRVEVRIETLVRREALARGLERFLPRHLSQLIWANALADKSANDLLVALRHEVLVRRNSTLADFSEAALVHIAWSYARMLGQPSQLGHDLVLIVGEELDRRSLDTLHSRHVSTLLWAMARLGCDSARVFNSAEGWLGDMDLAELSDQSLVMVIWAMTTVSRASMKNLARVEGEMLRRGLGSFQPQELNAAVFAFSMAKTPKAGSGRWEGPIWEAIDAEAARRNTRASSSNAGAAADAAAAASAVGQPMSPGVQALRDDAWGAENGEEDIAVWIEPQDASPSG